MLFRSVMVPCLLLGGALLAGCARERESVPDVPAEEVTRSVPALDALHAVMLPMWHQAWPARDVAAIQTAAAEFEPLVAAVDGAVLPGILRDEQSRWDEQKARFLDAFEGMRSAAEAGDGDELLSRAEAFHLSYEGLVRIVSPLVPELERFHSQLYGLYHYYSPGYDVEKMRRSAEAMAGVLPALAQVHLPDRLSNRQADYDQAVARLDRETAALARALEQPTREGAQAATERAHAAYQAVEAVFD